jgi:hypothetical protein
MGMMNSRDTESGQDFTPHGYYTISNAGGYLIEMSPCCTMARTQECWGGDNPKVSDWHEIEYIVPDECGECGEEAASCLCEDEPESVGVIDPEGMNIPMSEVFLLKNNFC